ncbi:hypothetical protein XENOCAPTIV_014894 [Xenoophorus captivus]|uniref:Secreted protein n=1 Tax=Xenoophorus captivus TaxID=1517983 RepID=A0ABV0QIC3_9TELE
MGLLFSWLCFAAPDIFSLIHHHSGFYSGVWESINGAVSRWIAHPGDFPLFVNFTQSTILNSVSKASRFKMTFTARWLDIYSHQGGNLHGQAVHEASCKDARKSDTKTWPVF